MKKIISLLIILSSTIFALEEWQNWSATGEVNALYFRDDLVWGATEGGIRAWSPENLEIKGHFLPSNGLAEVEQVYLGETQDGFFAVGKTGSISQYENGTFVTKHIGFSQKNVSLKNVSNPDNGSYLILNFGQSVSFFNTQLNRSELTLFWFDQEVQKVVATSDELYVLGKNKIWNASINVNNIQRDATGKVLNLSDPTSWKVTDYPDYSAENKFIRQLFEGTVDSLWGFVNDENGGVQILQGEQRVLILGGDTLSEPTLYNGEYPDGEWSTNWTAYTWDSLSDQYWLGRNSTVCRISPKREAFCYAVSDIPFRSFPQIALDPQGTPLAWGEHGFIKFEGSWKLKALYDLWGDGTATIMHSSANKTLVAQEDSWVMGSLGLGLVQQKGEDSLEYYHSSRGACLTEVLALDENAIPVRNGDSLKAMNVVSSVIFDAEEGGWWMTYSGQESGPLGWRVAFLRSNGELICANNLGKEYEVSGIFKDSLTDRFLVLEKTEISLWDFRLDGNQIRVQKERTLHLQQLGNPFQVARDAVGRLWVATREGLGVLCEGDFPDKVCGNKVNTDTLANIHNWYNFGSNRFSALVSDVQGNIWLGTSGAGVYQLQTTKKELSAYSLTNWRVNSGLLDDQVFDLRIDSLSGAVWVTHPTGISRMNSKSRIQDGFGKGALEPMVYPNPINFLEAERLTFDNIPADSRLTIYTRSGQVVKEVAADEMLGGAYFWGGENQQGKFVAPGLYWWSVSNKKRTWKGKFILLR